MIGRDHTRDGRRADTSSIDLPELAPGRATRTEHLVGGTPLTSGILRRKADGDGVHAHAEDALAQAATSTGAPLPSALRERFETSLGADLGAVRVHTGAESQVAAQSVSARAYTVGQDIHFGADQYDPGTTTGQHLLAHEVAHTVQQGGGGAPRFKLEVSTPGDALEQEADRAADAMVLGQPAAVGAGAGVARQVVQRDFFGQEPQAVPPGTFPVAPGLGGNPLAPEPGMAFGGAPALLAPNADARGVPYTVPGSDWTANVKPIPLPLDKAMPRAAIPKPKTIPGWKAPIPPHPTQIGAFTVMDPGDPNYVVTQHSASIKSSWDYYLYHVIQDVETTWNSGVSSLDSFTQAAGGTGNESIELLLKDMKPGAKWGLSANEHGKGSMADQANASSANSTGGAGSVSDVAKGVGDLTYVPAPKLDKSTDFTKALENTGSGGPVQDQLQVVQTAHENYKQHLSLCQSKATDVSGAADTLKAAGLGMKAKELDEKKEGLEQQKKDIESGKATLAAISPQLADVVMQCKDMYETIEKYVTASNVQKAATELEKGNYIGAAKEAATGVLAIVKMEKIQAIDAQIAAAVSAKKAALDAATVATYEGARKTFAARLGEMKTMAERADTLARAERNEMKKLADVVEKNWKGNTGDAAKDAQQGKLAAGALRALPIANKILSLVQDVRKNVPTKLPGTGGFGSEQAHTLATQGVGAPGDAELVEVGGWIQGIQPAVDGEVEKWQLIVGQLQIVVSKLGLQGV